MNFGLTDSFLLCNLILKFFQIHVLVTKAYKVKLLLTFKLKVDCFLHLIFIFINFQICRNGNIYGSYNQWNLNFKLKIELSLLNNECNENIS